MRSLFHLHFFPTLSCPHKHAYEYRLYLYRQSLSGSQLIPHPWARSKCCLVFVHTTFRCFLYLFLEPFNQNLWARCIKRIFRPPPVTVGVTSPHLSCVEPRLWSPISLTLKKQWTGNMKCFVSWAQQKQMDLISGCMRHWHVTKYVTIVFVLLLLLHVLWFPVNWVQPKLGS